MGIPYYGLIMQDLDHQPYHLGFDIACRSKMQQFRPKAEQRPRMKLPTKVLNCFLKVEACWDSQLVLSTCIVECGASIIIMGITIIWLGQVSPM